MKRDTAIVMIVIAAANLYCFLFPIWRWTTSNGDVGFETSARAFVFSPPDPSARVNIYASVSTTVAIIGIAATGLVVFRCRKYDKEAAMYWKSKWEQPDGKSKRKTL